MLAGSETLLGSPLLWGLFANCNLATRYLSNHSAQARTRFVECS